MIRILHVRSQLVLSLVVGISIHLFVNAEWDISMVVKNNVAGAIGGEQFSLQPMISIFNLKGVTKQNYLEGRVIATLENSASNTELHELLGIVSPKGDCYVNENDEISAPVVDGDATFFGLCVNVASHGYRIRYTLKDEYNITLGFVTGAPFTVKVGNPYKIGVIQCPTNVLGGLVWDKQPIVAVQDRGGNTVESVNEGSVSVAIAGNENAEKLIWYFETYLLSDEWVETLPTSKRWVEGVASFRGIAINRAGTYQLNFTTDLLLPGKQPYIATNVTVGIGPPHDIIVLEEPSENRIYGGDAFLTQPKLKIVDRGGNTLLYDQSSLATVSLYSNPANATLSPSTSMVATSSQGIIQFEHLKIDKHGTGFRFQYELYVFDNDMNDYFEANITKIGSLFNVEVAPPDHIEFLQLPSSEIWAGNQPFLQQPILALMDAGGNIVEHESCGKMNAMMTESLSQTSEIVVDTRYDDIPVIESLHFLPNGNKNGDNLFSVGQNISIIVTFSQEVQAILHSNTTSNNKKLPSLELNVIEEDNARSKALLILDDVPSRQFHFRYTVSKNSQQNVVNIISRNALKTNDYIIVDAWKRRIDNILPNPDSATNFLPAQNISVHSEPAKIMNITTDAISGEYAAGDRIRFYVDFNHEVSVQNFPEIPINVKSSIVIIDVAELGTSYSKSYFYIWYKGQRSMSIPWDASSSFVKYALEKIVTMTGSVCVSRAVSILNSGGFRWAVRFQSNLDDFNDGLSIQTANVRSDHEASNVSLTHVVTNEALQNWTVIDGENNMCTDRSADYLEGSGTKTLIFQYQVLPWDNINTLKFSNSQPVVIVGMNTRITNAINNGAISDINAKLDWDSINIGKEISIDASRPYIENVQFVEYMPDIEDYHAGEKLYFNVKFSKKVVVEGSAYFTLDVSRYDNRAIYCAGSGSNEIIFEYRVLPSHWSNALKYGDAQSQIHISHGHIRHLSSNPSLDVDLTLPTTGSPFQTKGSYEVQVDGRTPHITSVFVSEGQVNEFKEGDVIDLAVQFSSAVSILDGPPVLTVSIGTRFREAPYFRGNTSNTLEFRYIIRVGDMFPMNHITCRMLCVSSGCLDGVSSEGYIKQNSSNPILDADLTLPYPSYGKMDSCLDFNDVVMDLISSITCRLIIDWKILNQMPIFNISGEMQVNTTEAATTKILNISTFHQVQVVSIGEVIRIQVTFTDEVYFTGTPPQLKLNINSSASYESGNCTAVFTFVFVVTIDDVVNALNWEIPNGLRTPFICKDFNPCNMMNENEEEVDLTIAYANGYSVKEMFPKIRIDSTTPTIESIAVILPEQTHCQSLCNYTAGDTITFFIKYNYPVSVIEPEIKIKLNAVDIASKESIFAIYDPSLSNATDLAFVYSIAEGHSTFRQPLSLYCEGTHDCNIIFPVKNTHSVVRRLATYPSLPADLKLPHRNINALNQDIFIDGISIPKVISVECRNGTGVFSPGDVILLDIYFSEYVQIQGSLVLLLNVGGNRTGSAVYLSGSGSKCLTFQYIVESGHCIPHLDYVDVHSLKTTSMYSAIRRLSEKSIIMADLKLPIPGTKGSLGSHSKIKIDCRVPFIVKVWSSNETGIYSTGDNITIMVQFSREIIVTGSPTILLETGKIDRNALFISHTDTSTLKFVYRIQLGDTSADLEYWTNEGLNRHSLSFNMHGGSIMLPATNPIIHADLHLNPAYGYLGGQKRTTLEGGIARFNGLKIGKRGSNYMIRFQYHSCIVNYTYDAKAMISVYESSEYHLYGDDFDREVGDALGSSVALDGHLLAIGAKNKRNAFSEVQVLTVQSHTNVTQNEVQIVSTQVNKAEAIEQIQSFSTYALGNKTISGNFSLSYVDNEKYFYASPLIVPADVSAGQLEVLMTNHFPNLGPVKVTRKHNDSYKGKNAWTWGITFMDSSNGVLPLRLNGSNLIGANKKMDSCIEKNTTMLDGYFTLRNPSNGYETRFIAFNASAIDLKVALEEDLGYVIKSVVAADFDEREMPHLGRRWTIIFSHFVGPNGLDIDVPNLEVSNPMLLGAGARVWTYVGFEGRGHVNGTFAVSFRDSELSAFVPFNASSLQLERALENLVSINDVTVSGRKDISAYSSNSGYTWTITFNSINVKKGEMWIDDFAGQTLSGNLPPLKVEGKLTGWNAKITVEYESGFGKEDTQAQWMAKSMGKDGLRSGHVVIYHGKDRQWFIESFLLPSDGDSNDNFGHSLSLRDSYVAIGAPNKEVYGVYEQQTLICESRALSGSFSVVFRGHRSHPIPFNATAKQMHIALLGVYRNTTNIHSMPEFSIEGSDKWGKSHLGFEEGFCTSSGNNVTITFITPDGGGLSTMESTSGDIESLEIDNSNLIAGRVTVIEFRKGTRILSGATKKENSIKTLGIKSGAVYIFQRFRQCVLCPYLWKESSKLTSIDGFDHPQYSALFGWSTVIASDYESNEKILAISSPGFNNASGKVYTFKGHDSEWRYENSILSSLWDDVTPGAIFGHSMAMENNTLIVGSPGLDGKKGSVYVFLRNTGRMGFLASQKISRPSEINKGDEFGHAISLSGHRALICAPNHNDTVDPGTFKMNNMKTGEKTGSCYVYERQDTFKPFKLMQKLAPTNIRNRNRFGYSCDISGDSLIIGQLEDFIEYDFYKNNSLDVRGRAHVFTYNGSAWNEVSYLYPYDPQSDDLFGSSVVIDQDTAVVGAPNRKLLGVNSGAASTFHLSFLNFYFPVNSHEVQEGRSLPMRLQRRMGIADEIIGVKSIEKNIDPSVQKYISTLFDFDVMDGLGPSNTAVDWLCGSEAFGRNFRKEGASRGNLWISGTYDYKGRSDYEQVEDFLLFQKGSVDHTINLYTTNDQVYEAIDERLCVQVFLPGMFASAKGDKRLNIKIKDDDDGLYHPSTYYRKFLNRGLQSNLLFGTTIDFAEDAQTLVVSSQTAPEADEHINSNGIIFVFNKTISNEWQESSVIVSPEIKETSSYFGQSLSIFKFSSNGNILLLIGAPGHSCAYVFFYDSSNNKWEVEAILQPFSESHVQTKHNFAGKKSTAISDNIAFIGASGLETVFVYKRCIDDKSKRVSWKPWLKLKSSDYDFDRYDNGYTTSHIHKQQFGMSISYKDRLLLVGAPYADYGNQGNKTRRENFDTDGVHNEGLGRGKVYVFHSSPMIIKVGISMKSQPGKGQFKLNLNTINDSFTTSAIPINAQEAVVKAHIELFSKIGQVEVHRTEYSQYESYTINWFISFKTLFSDELNITALWKNHGCEDCDYIEGSNTTNSNIILSIQRVSELGSFKEESIIQGNDVTSGDRFGSSIDLGINEAIVGAMFSSAKTRTTWDFETGTLVGWVANGDAFDHQPVFGDNSKRRIVYEGFGKPDSKTSGLPQSANMQGRYYIGTFEKRPGNTSDYLSFDDRFIEGTIQGDLPTGTLTSDPFIILGDEISFLIGGGCDHLTEYVELLVDGFATMRATGKCSEGMERVKWKVHEFKQRAARIRIVDKAEGLWGHINIDDIVFSWISSGINSGGCSNTGGMLPKMTEKSKQHYSGQEESPLSGAAYIFVRNCSASDWVLAQQGFNCIWKQDQRITPSDKRSNSLFGSSVSIDSTKGLAYVGSHKAPLLGRYKELPTIYPHYNPWIKFPVKQKLEYLMKSGQTLSPISGNLQVTNHINSAYDKERFFLVEKFSEQAGATYIFKRTDAVRSSNDGSLLRAPFWQNFEHAKLGPSDLSGNDWFGSDVKIIGNKAITAAVHQKHCCNDTQDLGAVYLFDTEFHSLKFSQVEYEAVEGIHDKVSITILREELSSSSTLTVGYSTSDLSAAGIDHERFDNCLNISIGKRLHCGDYEQTSGYVTFQPGELSRTFDVRIMDDYCWERHLEFVQVNMHIPGGALILGERYRAQLRIDDDDWLSKNTTRITCID